MKVAEKWVVRSKCGYFPIHFLEINCTKNHYLALLTWLMAYSLAKIY